MASKSYLITIGDRSVGGLVARDQMVGPWQVPVADVAVANRDFYGVTGQAIAIGEQAPVYQEKRVVLERTIRSSRMAASMLTAPLSSSAKAGDLSNNADVLIKNSSATLERSSC